MTDSQEYLNSIIQESERVAKEWEDKLQEKALSKDGSSTKDICTTSIARQMTEWLKDYRNLKQSAPKEPCDLCRYAPPSSGDGKPCCICPAVAKEQ